MRNFRTLVASVSVIAVVLTPNMALAGTGKILIDAARHGEAYYVNPATDKKVYLGRPDEALVRLAARAEYIAFDKIELIGVGGAANESDAIADEYAGKVIAPRDLIGAAWYVHPVLKTRMRLATAQDAWDVMRTGTASPSRSIDVIADDPDPAVPPSGKRKVAKVISGNELELQDGTKIRLDSTDVPSNEDLQAAAMSRLSELAVGKEICLEGDIRDAADDGVKLRHAWSGDVLLSLDLVRRGLAFHNVIPPNFHYAEQLIVAGYDAEHHQSGFWKK